MLSMGDPGTREQSLCTCYVPVLAKVQLRTTSSPSGRHSYVSKGKFPGNGQIYPWKQESGELKNHYHSTAGHPLCYGPVLTPSLSRRTLGTICVIPSKARLHLNRPDHPGIQLSPGFPTQRCLCLFASGFFRRDPKCRCCRGKSSLVWFDSCLAFLLGGGVLCQGEG